MDKVLDTMDKVLEIIDRHIKDYDTCMNGIVAYEVDMVECDCALSKSESERLEKRWTEYFERRSELVSLRKEILQAIVLE